MTCKFYGWCLLILVGKYGFVGVRWPKNHRYTFYNSLSYTYRCTIHAQIFLYTLPFALVCAHLIFVNEILLSTESNSNHNGAFFIVVASIQIDILFTYARAIYCYCMTLCICLSYAAFQFLSVSVCSKFVAHSICKNGHNFSRIPVKMMIVDTRYHTYTIDKGICHLYPVMEVSNAK